MNKKGWVRFAMGGLCALVFATGCSSENTGSRYSHTDAHTDGGTERLGNTRQTALQEKDNQPQEDIEQILADYRSDREKGESKTPDGYVLALEPNEENYGFGVGDTSYTSRFDTKEVSEAFKAAEKYMEDTFQTEPPLYTCADPRMTAIYNDTDKGVANGYAADNIFLCEYSENGEWQYIILVREGKGEKWTVLFRGNTYKQQSSEEED